MTRHVVALVLASLGVAVIVASCLAAVVAADTLPRLHFATPVTSLGTPLVSVGLCVESGLGLTAATIIAIAVIVMVSGPVLSAAVGRVAGQLEGQLPPDEPQ